MIKLLTLLICLSLVAVSGIQSKSQYRSDMDAVANYDPTQPSARTREYKAAFDRLKRDAPKLVDLLRSSLVRGRTPSEKYHAGVLLAHANSFRATEVLLDNCRSNDQSTVTGSLVGLRQILLRSPSVGTKNRIRSAADSIVLQVSRRNAVIALQMLDMIADPKSVAVLSKYLGRNSSCYPGGLQAAQTLGKIGNRDAMDALRREHERLLAASQSIEQLLQKSKKGP